MDCYIHAHSPVACTIPLVSLAYAYRAHSGHEPDVLHCVLPFVQYLLPDAVQAVGCRYVAFFSLRGIAEWALASGTLIAEGKGPSEEAAQQEALMYQQLGILRGMDKGAKWTSGLNWYR